MNGGWRRPAEPNGRTAIHALDHITAMNSQTGQHPRSATYVLAHMLAWVIGGVLLIFNLRRLLFLAAACWDLYRNRHPEVPPVRGESGSSPRPETASLAADVLILVPLRNEAPSLPGLLESLLALEYPRALLTIGLIDDGSTDGGSVLLRSYAAHYDQVKLLSNPQSLGKASALNAGLRRWPKGDIIVVYDADARPRPDSLHHLVEAFQAPDVAATSGLIRPGNGLASPVATYAAIERLVHQQVTMRAKDRLGLAPAILGSNCAYRRTDLVAADGFPDGAFLEDSHLTLAFAQQGRATRFLPEAVALDQVPETLAAYWRQHVRWGRGFHAVAGEQFSQRSQSFAAGGGPASAPEAAPSRTGLVCLALGLELWLFSLGYLDRLALLAGLAMLSLGRAASLLAPLIGLNLALPYAQIAVALIAEQAPLAWWLRLPLVPLFFVVDVAAALWSLALSVARQPRLWQPTRP